MPKRSHKPKTGISGLVRRAVSIRLMGINETQPLRWFSEIPMKGKGEASWKDDDGHDCSQHDRVPTALAHRQTYIFAWKSTMKGVGTFNIAPDQFGLMPISSGANNAS